jgi:hypothetical protein
VTRVYDLAMTHQLDADDFFIHRVQQHCAERGLNFFLIEPLWVEAFFDQLQRGKVWPRALLNMHSEHHQPADIYHRLVKLAAEKGAKVIDPPDAALAAFNKANLHPRLEAAGLRVPPTLIVKREEAAGFRMSDADRERLGSPFVIKPAMGYGKRGVILDATAESDLARSVAAWPDEHYLVQQRIIPRWLMGLPAYFRVYFVFGAIWLCWWNCFTDHYRLVTPTEQEQFALDPLREIAGRIASLTGMNFFSSEVAQVESGEFIVIDYVNDQCHLLTQTADPRMGVPDELVAAIAKQLVEAAQALIRK